MSWNKKSNVVIDTGIPDTAAPPGTMRYDDENNIFYISEGNGNWGGFNADSFYFADPEVSGLISLTIGGSADTEHIQGEYTAVPGVITIAGAAIGIDLEFSYTGSGVGTISGIADTEIDDPVFIYSCSGSITIGGAAVCIGIDHETYVGSGGITIGGSADCLGERQYEYAPSGGKVTLSGLANYTYEL